MYDLIVLGGGPAGYNAAERAGHAGLKTLVIEERALGGVCLNEGCIPTKTLLYSAKIYDYAKHGKDYGVTFGSADFDHAFVVNRKNGVVKQLVSGIGAKLKKCGVEVVKASAVIKERNAEGFVVTADGRTTSESSFSLLPAPPQRSPPSTDLLILSRRASLSPTARSLISPSSPRPSLSLAAALSDLRWHPTSTR